MVANKSVCGNDVLKANFSKIAGFVGPNLLVQEIYAENLQVFADDPEFFNRIMPVSLMWYQRDEFENQRSVHRHGLRSQRRLCRTLSMMCTSTIVSICFTIVTLCPKNVFRWKFMNFTVHWASPLVQWRKLVSNSLFFLLKIGWKCSYQLQLQLQFHRPTPLRCHHPMQRWWVCYNKLFIIPHSPTLHHQYRTVQLLTHRQNLTNTCRVTMISKTVGTASWDLSKC